MERLEKIRDPNIAKKWRATVRRELKAAGIPVAPGEVPCGLLGELGTWTFCRSDDMWQARTEAQGIPRALAEMFNDIWGEEVRVWDVADMDMKVTLGDDVEFIDYYAIYTPEGLAAFAHLIKAFAKE